MREGGGGWAKGRREREDSLEREKRRKKTDKERKKGKLLNCFSSTFKLSLQRLPFSCSISPDLTVGVFDGESLRVVRVTNESKHLERMMEAL